MCALAEDSPSAAPLAWTPAWPGTGTKCARDRVRCRARAGAPGSRGRPSVSAAQAAMASAATGNRDTRVRRALVVVMRSLLLELEATGELGFGLCETSRGSPPASGYSRG